MIENSLLIKNCNLIDGRHASVQENIDVLILNGKIEKIGKKLSIRESLKSLDLDGLTLLPGMIDAHVHLAFDGSDDPVNALLSENNHLTLIKMVLNCQTQLQNGVTTVRDMGGPQELVLALRESWRKQILVGPRMLVSGEVITSKGGHCHFIGHEVDCHESAMEAVQHEMTNGVDLLKIMATGGSLTPGSSVHITQFTENEIAAIVQKAHQYKIKVAAHANALEGIRNAINAHVDSIEHGSFADVQALRAMVEKGIFLVPTMTPAEILIGSKQISETRRKDVMNNWESRKEVVKEAISMGLKLASGTDAGTTYVPHGCVAKEIQLFCKLGMNPMNAIWTATSRAAELLGISDQVGTIEVGKVADMIAVRGNPIDDLQRLETPALVIVAGQVVKNHHVKR